MGSPLAPVLSNLVLERLFDNVLPNLENKSSFFKFYVDDCFCALPLSKIQHLLTKLNAFHPKIQFTFECEDSTERVLPFLDLKLVHMSDHSVRVDWYNKPTASGQILNVLSCHSFSQKINVATAFARRVLSLSHPSFHNANKIHIFDILSKNNYPSDKIKNIINKVSHTFSNISDVRSTRYSASLHYIPNVYNRY
jgi:hypothetical protein